MTRTVHKHYPVEKLPEDLREGLSTGKAVKVIVEEEDENPSLDDLHATVMDILNNPKPWTLRELRQMAGPRNVTADEAVARIRALRDGDEEE